MQSLTEFLLARIAEDEAPTFELVPYECAPGCCAPAGWVGAHCLICKTTDFGGTVEAITQLAHEHEDAFHQRQRALAECEAKRRIVDLHPVRVERDWVNPVDGPAHEVNEHYCAICGWVPDSCDTVKALALPYADHPDYRSAAQRGGWNL